MRRQRAPIARIRTRFGADPRCREVTKGAGSRRRGLVMAYKLLDAAQDRWRKANSPELVALLRVGVEFKDGIQLERRTDETTDAA